MIFFHIILVYVNKITPLISELYIIIQYRTINYLKKKSVDWLIVYRKIIVIVMRLKIKGQRARTQNLIFVHFFSRVKNFTKHHTYILIDSITYIVSQGQFKKW